MHFNYDIIVQNTWDTKKSNRAGCGGGTIQWAGGLQQLKKAKQEMEKTTLDFKNKDNSRNQNTIQKINETKSKGNLSADKSSYQKSK